jgi:hypothetical protein
LTYRVTQDLSSCNETCLIVANDRITIDLQGHRIASDCPDNFGAGITDAGVARDSITVKNGTVSSYNFGFGIDLRASSLNTVRNVTASANFEGIAVGSQSLVKDCHVGGNFTAITGGDRVQIQGSDVNENTNGISVGDQCLITSNVASNNAGVGIFAGGKVRSANEANTNGAGGSGVATRAWSPVTWPQQFRWDWCPLSGDRDEQHRERERPPKLPVLGGRLRHEQQHLTRPRAGALRKGRYRPALCSSPAKLCPVGTAQVEEATVARHRSGAQ